jgi:hypothetical protein
LEHALGVGRGAYRAAGASHHGFDGSRGIDIGEWGDARAGAGEAGEYGLQELGRRHVGHDAASFKHRRVDFLLRPGEDGRAFGHEVHSAEHDMLGGKFGDPAGEFQGIAHEMGVLYDGVRLVVVGEDGQLVLAAGDLLGKTRHASSLGSEIRSDRSAAGAEWVRAPTEM